jgi:hypothetical protein
LIKKQFQKTYSFSSTSSFASDESVFFLVLLPQ